MTNLFSGQIDTNGEYKSLATEAGLIFTAGSKYIIQLRDNAFLREGDVGTGFLCGSFPVSYTAGNETLYIKGNCHVNIAN